MGTAYRTDVDGTLVGIPVKACRTYRSDVTGEFVTTCDSGTVTPPTNTAPVQTGSTYNVADITDNASIVIYDSQLTQGYADPEGSPLDAINFAVDHGSVVDYGTYIVYYPEPGYTGPVNLTYDISDGTNSVPESITFNVDGNEAPTGTALYTIGDQQEGTTFTVSYSALALGFTDPDGDSLTVQNVGVAGSLLYTTYPTYVEVTVQADSAGQTAALTWEITDGTEVISASKTFNITAAPNVPPSGSSSLVIDGTIEDVAFFIPENDIIGDVTDADGDPLVITNLSVSHGSLSAAPGGYIYTPPANYSGSPTITATISDGTGSISVGREFTVIPVHDPLVDTTPGRLIGTYDQYVAGFNTENFSVVESNIVQGVTSPEGLPLSVQSRTIVDGFSNIVETSPGVFRFSRIDGFTGTATVNFVISDTVTTITVERNFEITSVETPPIYTPGNDESSMTFQAVLNTFNRDTVTYADILEGITSSNPIDITNLRVDPTSFPDRWGYARVVSTDATSFVLEKYEAGLVSILFTATDSVTGASTEFKRTFNVLVSGTVLTWPNTITAPNFILHRLERLLLNSPYIADAAEAQTVIDDVLQDPAAFIYRDSLGIPTAPLNANDGDLLYVHTENNNVGSANRVYDFAAPYPIKATNNSAIATQDGYLDLGQVDINLQGNLFLTTDHIIGVAGRTPPGESFWWTALSLGTTQEYPNQGAHLRVDTDEAIFYGYNSNISTMVDTGALDISSDVNLYTFYQTFVSQTGSMTSIMDVAFTLGNDMSSGELIVQDVPWNPRYALRAGLRDFYVLYAGVVTDKQNYLKFMQSIAQDNLSSTIPIPLNSVMFSEPTSEAYFEERLASIDPTDAAEIQDTYNQPIVQGTYIQWFNPYKTRPSYGASPEFLDFNLPPGSRVWSLADMYAHSDDVVSLRAYFRPSSGTSSDCFIIRNLNELDEYDGEEKYVDFSSVSYSHLDFGPKDFQVVLMSAVLHVGANMNSVDFFYLNRLSNSLELKLAFNESSILLYKNGVLASTTSHGLPLGDSRVFVDYVKTNPSSTTHIINVYKYDKTTKAPILLVSSVLSNLLKMNYISTRPNSYFGLHELMVSDIDNPSYSNLIGAWKNLMGGV